MWQPGAWNWWTMVRRYVGTAPAVFHPPVRPTGSVGTVIVGRGGAAVSAVPPTRLIVNSGSAGVGLSRGARPNPGAPNTPAASTPAAVRRAPPRIFAASRRALTPAPPP